MRSRWNLLVQNTFNGKYGTTWNDAATTNANTARRIVMMARMATIPMIPATGFSSSLTICASDFPSRRMELNRITKSCTAPPSTTPIRIHSVPGR